MAYVLKLLRGKRDLLKLFNFSAGNNRALVRVICKTSCYIQRLCLIKVVYHFSRV